MTINEFIKDKEYNISDIVQMKTRIYCIDDLNLSVQASWGHYCDPRIDAADFYTSVEIGYPSIEIPELMEYAEDPEDPTETVYGYVPVSLVNKIIKDYGGIDPLKTLTHKYEREMK